jgi:hypothetical protein
VFCSNTWQTNVFFLLLVLSKASILTNILYNNGQIEQKYSTCEEQINDNSINFNFTHLILNTLDNYAASITSNYTNQKTVNVISWWRMDGLLRKRTVLWRSFSTLDIQSNTEEKIQMDIIGFYILVIQSRHLL